MTPYRAKIEMAAQRHAIDADLLDALVWKESNYQADAFRFEPAFWERYLKDKPEYATQNPRRVSSSYGLCQLMLPVARELGFRHEPEMLFLPDLNLDLGARKLAALLAWAEGDKAKALGAYNAGQGGWNSAAGRAYADSILNRYYKATGGAR